MGKHAKIAVLVAAAFTLSSSAAFGIGISAKLKSKKMQGDLVPAYAPTDTGSNTGDDENDSPAFNEGASVRQSNCTFEKGSFKFQTGKDGQVKLSAVKCGGTPFNGTLCAHAKAVSTILNEDIDTANVSTPKTCVAGVAGDIAGRINWVTVNIGQVTCINGACKGTLPTVAADPCPDVDKVTEYRRVEVFNGPDQRTLSVLGTNLTACCGPGQTLVGNVAANGGAPCNTSTQDVMGIGGTVLQGVLP